MEDKPELQTPKKSLAKPTLETTLGFIAGITGGAITSLAELTTNASITNPNLKYTIGIGTLLAGGVLVMKGMHDYCNIVQELYTQTTSYKPQDENVQDQNLHPT